MSNISLISAEDVKSQRKNSVSINPNCEILGTALRGAEVLDHDHSNCVVRGVLHRQSNVFLGKIENSYKRYIRNISCIGLPDLLRSTANYLEHCSYSKYKIKVYHPQWIKRVQIDFKKLNVKNKEKYLEVFHGEQIYNNDVERLKALMYSIKTVKDFDFHRELLHELNKG
jgi:hypothetical protein